MTLHGPSCQCQAQDARQKAAFHTPGSRFLACKTHKTALFLKKTRKKSVKFCRNEKLPYLCTRLRQVRALSSAGLEHLPYKQRVGGSNPSAPTTIPITSRGGWDFFFTPTIRQFFSKHTTDHAPTHRNTPPTRQQYMAYGHKKSRHTECNGMSSWALRDSNPRPSACKADALNQLS